MLSLKTAAAALNDSDALTYSPQGFRKVQGGWNAEGVASLLHDLRRTGRMGAATLMSAALTRLYLVAEPRGAAAMASMNSASVNCGVMCCGQFQSKAWSLRVKARSGRTR